MVGDLVWSTVSGSWVDLEAKADFAAACAAYWHDTEYRQFLNAQRARGIPAAQAIEALRKELGAQTRQEKRAAWEAKQEGWRQARIAKLQAQTSRSPGRPKQELGVAEAKAQIASALFITIAKLERRDMPDDTRQLLDGMKKQLASW